MYMDLTDMISGGTEEQQVPEQKLIFLLKYPHRLKVQLVKFII